VAKIESIRPGGSLESTFAAYPLADLLIGILRGNLSGCLDVALAPIARNNIYFKDGVPVSVSVPDLGVSVARILVEHGDITKERAMEILREAEDSGRRESGLIVEEKILSEGALVDARRRRAREELVRLFDAFDAAFAFREGAELPESAALTILQPLPIVYEGLLSSRDRGVVNRFLDEYATASFRLAATYPRGVDPFEWGASTESAIGALSTLHTFGDLERAGLSRHVASAALATLHLAGMLEVHRKPSTQERKREELEARAEAVPKSGRLTREPPLDPAADDREPSGLVVHRRAPAEKARGPDVRASVEARDSSTDEPDLELVTAKLAPLRGKSYFKVLRVGDNSSADQIERSFRYLIRQTDEMGSDAGTEALRDLLNEAFDVLADAERGRRYRELNERSKTSPIAVTERQALEAVPKVERALRAMADGRIAEATFLLEWSQALDGTRRDIKLYRNLLRYFRVPRPVGVSEILAVKPAVLQELQRTPGDPTLELFYALILAEEGDHDEAKRIADAVGNPDHPLARRILEVRSFGP
jgi:hypothetical protein